MARETAAIQTAVTQYAKAKRLNRHGEGGGAAPGCSAPADAGDNADWLTRSPDWLTRSLPAKLLAAGPLTDPGPGTRRGGLRQRRECAMAAARTAGSTTRRQRGAVAVAAVASEAHGSAPLTRPQLTDAPGANIPTEGRPAVGRQYQTGCREEVLKADDTAASAVVPFNQESRDAPVPGVRRVDIRAGMPLDAAFAMQVSEIQVLAVCRPGIPLRWAGGTRLHNPHQLPAPICIHPMNVAHRRNPCNRLPAVVAAASRSGQTHISSDRPGSS